MTTSYQVWNTDEDAPHADTLYPTVEEATEAMVVAGKSFPAFAVPLAVAEISPDRETQTRSDRGGWATALPWRGRPGWGIARDRSSGAFWVNMGRAWYGPFTTEAQAQALLDAETAGA